MFADGEQSNRLKTGNNPPVFSLVVTPSGVLAVVRAQRPILRRDEQATLRSCSMVLCAAKPLHPPYEKHANVLTFQTAWLLPSRLKPQACSHNRLAPLRPRALAGEKGEGLRGPTERKAVLVAQKAALFFRVRKPPDLEVNQSKGFYCNTSLRLPFDPIRSNWAGFFKFLAVGCGLHEIAPSAISVVDWSIRHYRG